MNNQVYIKEAWRSLYASKQRTLLALIGIVIGIASVIALVSIGKIVTAEAAKQFLAMGTDLISVRLNADRGEGESLHDLDLFIEMDRHVACLSVSTPYIRQSIEIVDDKGNQDDIDVIATIDSFAKAGKIKLTAGRFVSALDSNQQYVVLGSDTLAKFGLKVSPQQAIGQEVVLKKQIFVVIGVLQSSPNIEQVGISVNESVFIPAAAASVIRPNAAIKRLLARVKSDVMNEACVQNVEQYFYRRMNGVKVRVTTAEQLIAQMRKQTDMLSTMLAAIGSISLIVGGVGIMNIMLVSVSERRQEIGIRRALGAKQKDIRYQFLVEALMLSLIGGFLGVVVGIAVAYAVAEMQQWQYFVSTTTLLLGAGVSALIGVFFGFFPAHQAAKLDPISALRSE